MDQFSELTAFIPVLENDAFGTLRFDCENNGTPEQPLRLPFVEYTPAMLRFVKTLYGFCNTHPEYGHTRYAETLEAYGLQWSANSMAQADLSNAEAKLVIALLIGAVRADRFSEGTLLEFCKNGCIVRWLQRLAAIDNDASGAL